MNFSKIMKDKVYVWRVGRDMRASKRGRERRSSQSVEGREGIMVGGVGHGQRVPVMEWTSQGWFSTHLSWWWWRQVTMIWQLTITIRMILDHHNEIDDDDNWQWTCLRRSGEEGGDTGEPVVDVESRLFLIWASTSQITALGFCSLFSGPHNKVLSVKNTILSKVRWH